MTEKNFYIMLDDPPWAGPITTTVSGPDFRIDDGVIRDDEQQPYEIILRVDKQAKNPGEFPPCDIHGLRGGLLFSQRFIDLLKKLNVDNIQYFDAKVTYEPTGLQLPYKAANIIGIVSGLDLDNSEVELDDDIVIDIESMCFDESKMEGYKIFRLNESIMHIIVHRSIKEAVEEADLTGFMFVTDEEYEPSMI
jgi:hypothetical protein